MSGYSTTDLALASVLSLNGYQLTMNLVNPTTVAWDVADDSTDELFEEIVREYDARRYRVEPRAFAQELYKVRKAMYSKLGIRASRLTKRSG